MSADGFDPTESAVRHVLTDYQLDTVVGLQG